MRAAAARVRQGVRGVHAVPRHAALLRQMHRDWLGDIYEWAGKYRTVELEKEGFIRDCSTPTGMQMLKSTFWGRLGRYEKDSVYSQSQTGAR